MIPLSVGPLMSDDECREAAAKARLEAVQRRFEGGRRNRRRADELEAYARDLDRWVDKHEYRVS